jgi:hypothetical protein
MFFGKPEALQLSSVTISLICSYGASDSSIHSNERMIDSSAGGSKKVNGQLRQ